MSSLFGACEVGAGERVAMSACSLNLLVRSHFDTDDDGKVSEHEFLQRMEPDYNSTRFSEDEMMKDVVNRWKADFTHNDLNNDGG